MPVLNNTSTTHYATEVLAFTNRFALAKTGAKTAVASSGCHSRFGESTGLTFCQYAL
jgi:hypothetical protein